MKKHLLFCAIVLIVSVPSWAGTNPGDYPMRVQFVTVSSQSRRDGIYHIGKAHGEMGHPALESTAIAQRRGPRKSPIPAASPSRRNLLFGSFSARAFAPKPVLPGAFRQVSSNMSGASLL